MMSCDSTNEGCAETIGPKNCKMLSFILSKTLESLLSFSFNSVKDSCFAGCFSKAGKAWISQFKNLKGRKVKKDHRSKFSNLSNWKEEA